MASDPSEPTNSFLDRLISSRNRDLSFLFPLLFGFTDPQSEGESQDPDQETQQTPNTHDRIIFVNPLTQGMVVIQGGRSFESLWRELSEFDSAKKGTPPASKASIDAMPKIEVLDDGDQCVICLEGLEIGGEAREMPCKHRYHSNCIQKWLGIHGSCPVCRFKMPVDDSDESGKRGGGGVYRDGGNGGDGVDEEGRRDLGVDREIWVSFSVNRRDSTPVDSSDEH
eukprot:TRINITY_DN19642_c0_g1_i1.p1 TRINITY_DN19642_c0_g1~~TRINITY_DN19642_c0_g1_i1.p1  ORF type:complete len:225 (+),score=49.28 TRINITY_DN19642_c0_g1_i1:147-821(+)